MISFKSIASSSAGNAYVVDDGHSQLLLECGISWKKIQQSLEFKTSGLAGCLVSHLHGDHAKSIKDVCFHGIDVYASEPTFEQYKINTNHRARIIKHGSQATVGSWRFVAFSTEHDSEGALGFLLVNKAGEKCLFLTDTAYSRFTFPPLHTIIIEANFSLELMNKAIKDGRVHPSRKHRLVETHLSIERVIDLLKANDLSQCQAIHLIHLSADNADAGLFKQMVIEETGIPTFVADE